MGTELKAIMEKERVSGYRISKEMNIDQSYISKLLNNKINPNYLTLKSILDVLGYKVKFVRSKK